MMPRKKRLVRMDKARLLWRQRTRTRHIIWCRHGVLGLLLLRLRRLRRLGWLGVVVGGDEEEIVHAVLCEFCEALAEERANEVLGAGKVCLED